MQDPNKNPLNNGGRKRRGRPPKSSNKNDDDFTLQSGTSQGSRMPTRSGSQSRSRFFSDYDDSLSDSENFDENPGPIIEDIIAGPGRGDAGAYVVKKPLKSYVQLETIDDSILNSGRKTQITLSTYIKSIRKGGKLYEISSPLGKDLTQPASKLLNPNVYFIERIITHKSDEDVQHIIPQHIEMDRYLPGLPIDGYADLSEFQKFTFPMHPPDDQPKLFVQDDGSFYLGPSNNSNDSVQDDDNEDKKDLGDEPPPKTQYFIKWKGLSIEQSTWETIESLTGEKYCAKNIDEFPAMLKNYWSRNKTQETIEKEIKEIDPEKLRKLEHR